jgi:hypothetical protein
MPTIGDDCHLILYHADVSAGLGDGFLIAEGTAIAAQRAAIETLPGVYTAQTKLFASIYCADVARLPNGGRDTRDRLTVYRKLCEYLAKRSGLTVVTPAGAYVNLYCLSHFATESHYGGYSLIVCTFNSVAAAFTPADPVAFATSFWVDGATYTGDRNWGNSIWRP